VTWREEARPREGAGARRWSCRAASAAAAAGGRRGRARAAGGRCGRRSMRASERTERRREAARASVRPFPLIVSRFEIPSHPHPPPQFRLIGAQREAVARIVVFAAASVAARQWTKADARRTFLPNLHFSISPIFVYWLRISDS
jgi:hypothetical protein